MNKAFVHLRTRGSIMANDVRREANEDRLRRRRERDRNRRARENSEERPTRFVKLPVLLTCHILHIKWHRRLARRREYDRNRRAERRLTASRSERERCNQEGIHGLPLNITVYTK